MSDTENVPSQGTQAAVAPVIILIEPQLGENIGSAARAMFNFGLSDLRLVRPRDGWPNPRAETMASGASVVLDRAQVFEDSREAVSDLNIIFATTARERDLTKKVLTPRGAAQALLDSESIGERSGLIFGPERSGLGNDDIAMADMVVNVPLNPGFSSLNLAHAVLLLGYEWFQARLQKKSLKDDWGNSRRAKIEEREYFYNRLEKSLKDAGFLYPEDLAPTICRNLRSMFNKAGLTSQEVRTLHGIITALKNYIPPS
ncbi:MAG: rRNA methyltransferase [Rhodospirillaceae bacterium]|nr:rRNA methyltransferase [Rhodospirillaceae bacterium]